MESVPVVPLYSKAPSAVIVHRAANADPDKKTPSISEVKIRIRLTAFNMMISNLKIQKG
jgi:hypothetical protein